MAERKLGRDLVKVAKLGIDRMRMVEIRDLPAGALIAVPNGAWGFQLATVTQVAHRYGEGSRRPYGRVWVRAHDDEDAEERAYFAPYGSMFLVLVPEDE